MYEDKSEQRKGEKGVCLCVIRINCTVAEAAVLVLKVMLGLVERHSSWQYPFNSSRRKINSEPRASIKPHARALQC